MRLWSVKGRVGHANELRDRIESARRMAVEQQHFFVAYLLEMAILALVQDVE